MRYLVTTNSHPPFFTANFNPENHFNPDSHMVVFDLLLHKYTEDGTTWHEIETDHL